MSNMFTWVVRVLFLLLLVLSLGVMFNENIALYMRTLFGLSEKSGVLEYLAFAGGGCLIILQIMIANRRARAMENTAAAQAHATKQQANANQNTEDGQRQERLKNAIEHLGHKSVSVRLGGAYELFHLAQDTQEFRQSAFSRLVQNTQELRHFGSRPLNTQELRQTVHDILCSHIRETTTEDKYLARYQAAPSTEIQSLLTLLFVQGHEVFSGLRANLVGSCLKGAGLRRARLRGAFLTEAQLQGAVLRSARLQGAFLRGARLLLADLRDARLQGAILHSAKLQGADMKNVGLQGASLGRSWLQAADLQGVQLQGVKFRAADDRASLPTFKKLITESIGQESDLSGVTFEGGVDRGGIDSLVNGLSDENAASLRGKLTPHIGKPRPPQLPEGSGAITGTYTEEEAETWITEYETDM